MAGLLDADIDVEHGETVAGEPAWLDGDGAAVDWPFCAVCRLGHTTTWRWRVSLISVCAAALAVKDTALTRIHPLLPPGESYCAVVLEGDA